MRANQESDFISLNLSQVLFAVPLGYGLEEVGGREWERRVLLKGDWGREGKRRSGLTSVERSGRQQLRAQNWLIYCSLPQILDINLLVYTFIFTSATIRVREKKV